jgi:hypothetical protein
MATSRRKTAKGAPKRSGKPRRTSARGSSVHAAAKAAAPRALVLDLAPGLSRLIGRSKAHIAARRALERNVTFTALLRDRPGAANGAAKEVQALGFHIVHSGEFGISVRATARQVEKALGIALGIQARPRRTRLRATRQFAMCYEPPAPEDLYVAPLESLSVRTRSRFIARFVFLPPPHAAASPSPAAPGRPFFGIDEASIRQLLNVSTAETGLGVTIGMVDSGFFPHPYYATRNYHPTPTPSVPNPQLDSEGHGTAMAYNALAVAPGARLLGFKKIPEQPQIAMEEAVAAGADIISCSWGWADEQRFECVEKAIRSIVARGKIVIFSTGNGTMFWPATMPEVLAVGGVYVGQDNQPEASNYASGFTTNFSNYQGRTVPDVCGLCGQGPRGVYIMLPCPPGSLADREYAGKVFPNGDQTPKDDGWFGGSGTSSAAAQIAGVVALMVERARTLGRPPLDTARVKQLLQQSATPVQKGKNAQGEPATGHPNLAVGFGLVNAAAAVALV